MLFKKFFIAVIVFITGQGIFAQTKTTVNSPDKNIQLQFWLSEQGAPMYDVSYKGKPVLLPSSMGFQLKGTMNFDSLPRLPNI